MPELEIAIPRPQRWDVPFGQMADADVDKLLAIEPFRSIDASAFPLTLPLRGILMGDTRIGHYQAGDVVVREGDYGNSAFLVLGGSVRVMLERLDPALLGREDPPRRGWLHAIAQLWQNASVPEARAGKGAGFTEKGAGSRERMERRGSSCKIFRGCWPTRERPRLGRAKSSVNSRRCRGRRERPQFWPMDRRRCWRFAGRGCAI